MQWKKPTRKRSVPGGARDDEHSVPEVLRGYARAWYGASDPLPSARVGGGWVRGHHRYGQLLANTRPAAKKVSPSGGHGLRWLSMPAYQGNGLGRAKNSWNFLRKVADVLVSSVSGLVAFLSVPNHIDVQSNKILDCMGAGVPDIAAIFLRGARFSKAGSAASASIP